MISHYKAQKDLMPVITQLNTVINALGFRKTIERKLRGTERLP